MTDYTVLFEPVTSEHHAGELLLQPVFVSVDGRCGRAPSRPINLDDAWSYKQGFNAVKQIESLGGFDEAFKKAEEAEEAQPDGEGAEQDSVQD